MAGISQNTFRPPLFQSDGSFTQGIRGVNHIIHNQASTTLNVADNVHDFRHISFRAAFIDNRQISIQGFGNGTGADYTADIRADNSQVFNPLLLDIVQQNRGSINIIHRNIKKTLNLVCVQINGQNTVNARRIEHICH